MSCVYRVCIRITTHCHTVLRIRMITHCYSMVHSSMWKATSRLMSHVTNTQLLAYSYQHRHVTAASERRHAKHKKERSVVASVLKEPCMQGASSWTSTLSTQAQRAVRGLCKALERGARTRTAQLSFRRAGQCVTSVPRPASPSRVLPQHKATAYRAGEPR